MNLIFFLKNRITYFLYFYKYLGNRIFISFFLSLCSGVLDGFGLAMFIPLLKMTDDASLSVSNSELGNLSFLPQYLESIGIDLNITNALIIIFIFFSLKGIVKFIEGYFRVLYQQDFMKKVRIDNIDNLNFYEYRQFVKADVGRIQNTFSGEVSRVNTCYKSYFHSIHYGVLVIVYVVFAFASNPKFALMVSIGGIISNFIFSWIYIRTKAYSKSLTKSWHYFQGLLIQQVALFKYLKATGLNIFYGKKLIDSIHNIENYQRKLGLVDSLLRALREPVIMLVVVIVILIQVKIFSGSLGLIILSLLFLYRALTFLMALQEHWNRFIENSASIENMQDFTEELKAGREKSGKIYFEKFRKNIILQNVGFYFDNIPVLNNIDLELKRNETVAIVGESGSGKSTLMHIICGLMLPNKGNVYIDDVSIKKLDLISYRKRIGYISQEAPIFNDTVFNNVTFWAAKTKENKNKFIEAIQKASIYDFIMGLPFKEDEFLGNNGINISGGQKQRISIARELYKDVDILLLDEATSSLDAETEKIIQKNIEILHGKYTMVLIAHRLSTIKNADRIILLNDGNIEAIGDYNSLLKSSSLFKHMVHLQNL